MQNLIILHRKFVYCTEKYLLLHKKLALTYLREMLIGQGQSSQMILLNKTITLADITI